MLQGMRLKWLMPLSVLAGCFCWSSSITGLKFVPIYEPLVIKAQKNSPPHIAFEEVQESQTMAAEWSRIKSIPVQNLATHKVSTPLYVQRVELSEMIFKKESELLAETSINRAPSSNSESFQEDPSAEWMNQLSSKQALRLQQAQVRSEILNEDWNSTPSWSDMAREVVNKENKSSSAAAPVYVAGVDSAGKKQTQVPQAQVTVPSSTGATVPDQNDQASENSFLPSAPGAPRKIVGPIEITGGLAVTNEHHIEIRRRDEGILKELGAVDLGKGLYNITVQDAAGSVIARLVNKDGKILGEGSFRLNAIANFAPNVLAQGPKIKIQPHADFGGTIANVYNTKALDESPKDTRVTFIKGINETQPKKDGSVSMDNVVKGSSTVMRSAAPSFMQTSAIIVSGKEFKSQLYPNSMIKALENLVSQERGLNLDGPPAVIWGRVTSDDKSLAGVEVSVESDPALQAVYFNQFMVPDLSLKATSENGLYAFIDASEGFHSLLATKNDSLIGYQNVVVESGSVAQGDIESTSKTESVPLRVYDAFSGDAQAAKVSLQSLDSEVEILKTARNIVLPQIERVGLMRVQPVGADYISANYLYNDKDEFIHAPLIQWSWLSNIKGYLKVEDRPDTGVIVGFVPDENFEAYLAGEDNQSYLVYFDMQGRILQGQKGVSGGGFIIYNAPADTHEVVVIGSRSQKIYSKVIPVDVGSLSVLSFRE